MSIQKNPIIPKSQVKQSKANFQNTFSFFGSARTLQTEKILIVEFVIKMELLENQPITFLLRVQLCAMLEIRIDCVSSSPHAFVMEIILKFSSFYQGINSSLDRL